MTPGRRSLFCLWDTNPTRWAHRKRMERPRTADGWVSSWASFVPSRSAKDGTKLDLHRDRSDKWGRGREQMVEAPQGEWRLPRCTPRARWPSGPRGSEQQPRSGLRYAARRGETRRLHSGRSHSEQYSLFALDLEVSASGRKLFYKYKTGAPSSLVALRRSVMPANLRWLDPDCQQNWAFPDLLGL